MTHVWAQELMFGVHLLVFVRSLNSVGLLYSFIVFTRCMRYYGEATNCYYFV